MAISQFLPRSAPTRRPHAFMDYWRGLTTERVADGRPAPELGEAQRLYLARNVARLFIETKNDRRVG